MKVKYPAGVIIKKEAPRKQLKKLTSSAANRGMALEQLLNLSNDFYNDTNRALITKRPTPINVVKVDYSRGARITDAYFEKQSTTDYNGLYRGKYIDFEAKSTTNSTSFPLSNIYSHQFEHLSKVIENGGIAFFIIMFTLIGEIYLIDAKKIVDFKNAHTRKSIPLTFIKKEGLLLPEGYRPRLDYLTAVDQLFFD